MPRQEKGPRLWLRPERKRRDGSTERAVWIILDGGNQTSTRCGRGDRDGAEGAFREYLNKKHLSAIASRGPRDGRAVPVADVIALYLTDVAPRLARPQEAAGRATYLLQHFGEHTVADLTGPTIRAYVAARGSAAAARRELEDLRAAVNHARKEGVCRDAIAIPLPPRGPSRERWLTRAEVARLLWAAWRYREIQNWRGTHRHTRRHIARFILLALYTGSRAGAVTGASFLRQPGHGWIDVDAGVFYRRPEDQLESKKRRPPIPLPPRLLAHLRRWRAVGARHPIAWNGQPAASIRKAFAAVVADAGLGPEVTPHVLRHTAVTWAMLNGADMYQAGRYFGLTAQMIERTYGHHHPDYLTGVRNAIVGRSPNVPPTKQANKTEKIVDLVGEYPQKPAGVK